VEIIRRARLPHDPRSWWQEPRSALWARVHVAGQPVNVITTHLGLGVHERVLQMQALLGEEWIGGIPEQEPVILCGDFNCLPRSAPYVMASRRLRDVQKGRDRRPLNTFTSIRPLVRLDHIFASAEIACLAVVVPRNDLTRVASDHLPLVADLRITSESKPKSKESTEKPEDLVAIAK
jgi:endonuclease/exonuclease/phosphatase family metal-dependent hydrolase